MDLPKSIPKATIKGHRQGITCLCFHPFYKRLASGSDDASIIIWECDEFTEERSLKAHTDTINCLTFDNYGKIFSILFKRFINKNLEFRYNDSIQNFEWP